MVLVNALGYVFGYVVATLFHFKVSYKITLVIEIGMQNAGLGTVLALKHIGERAAIPAAIFVFICIITSSVMAEIWQRRAKNLPVQ